MIAQTGTANPVSRATRPRDARETGRRGDRHIFYPAIRVFHAGRVVSAVNVLSSARRFVTCSHAHERCVNYVLIAKSGRPGRVCAGSRQVCGQYRTIFVDNDIVMV